MKYYAVIDTNVIVSSMLKRESIPGHIIDLVVSKTIVPLFNEEILEEYYEVLTRNKFDFLDNDVNNLLALFRSNGISYEREKTLEKFIDEEDIVFYEIVLSARKDNDAYLVTGNKKDFPIKRFVVTPKEMIDIITQ